MWGRKHKSIKKSTNKTTAEKNFLVYFLGQTDFWFGFAFIRLSCKLTLWKACSIYNVHTQWYSLCCIHKKSKYYMKGNMHCINVKIIWYRGKMPGGHEGVWFCMNFYYAFYYLMITVLNACTHTLFTGNIFELNLFSAVYILWKLISQI